MMQFVFICRKSTSYLDKQLVNWSDHLPWYDYAAFWFDSVLWIRSISESSTIEELAAQFNIDPQLVRGQLQGFYLMSGYLKSK